MAGRRARRKTVIQSSVEEIFVNDACMNSSESTDFEDDDDPTWTFCSRKRTSSCPSESSNNTDSVDPLQLPVVRRTTKGQSASSKKAQAALKKAEEANKWKPTNFKEITTTSDSTVTDVQHDTIKAPIEYFKQYFSEKHYEDAAKYTNMYSLAESMVDLKTTSAEIKQLYGAHLVVGTYKYPRLSHYFKRGYELQLVTRVFTRDRLYKLRSNLHYVDSNDPDADKTNKMWKIQPIIDCVRNQCRKIPRKVAPHSIDEQMIPFTGRCPVRQVVRRKPRPVGLKNFVLTTSDGMILHFEIYQGESTPFPDTSLGSGAAAVIRLVETLLPGSSIYFDRYYTTIPLLDKLLTLGFFSTGTIQINRLPPINFSPDNKMKRGDIEEFTRDDAKVVAIKWRDNKCVTIVSTQSGKEPTATLQRWCKKQKAFIGVTTPAVVQRYNSYMGGVDLADQMLEYYRTFFKTRKWTLKTSIHFIDLAVVNSWFEYRNDCKLAGVPKKKWKDLLSFRMELAKILLSTPKSSKRILENIGQELPPPKKKCSITPLPCDSMRMDRTEHWPAAEKLIQAKMCRRKGCRGKSRIKCTRCDVFLCLNKNKNCFKVFHNEV